MTVVEENNKYVTRDLISWKRSSWYTDACVQSIYEQKVVEKGKKGEGQHQLIAVGVLSPRQQYWQSVCIKIERSFIYKWDTMTTAADDDFYQHVLCHNNYYFYDLNLPPVWREGRCWWWWYINKNNSAHTHTNMCKLNVCARWYINLKWWIWWNNDNNNKNIISNSPQKKLL